MNKQEETRLMYYNFLKEKGYDCELINDGSCRLDILIHYHPDTDSKMLLEHFSKGILAVMWSSSGVNHKVEFLGSRINGFDGYEIKGKWYGNITLSNIVEFIENDIKELNDYIDYHVLRRKIN